MSRGERASPPAEYHVLSGWGESHHGWAQVERPRNAADVADALRRAADDGARLCLRGSGRSYGDAALLSRGRVLDMTALSAIRSFDAGTGVVVAEAGVSIEQLWRVVLPRGWWPAVVTGTMRPTVGGSIAMNVHGKNHFKAGGFGDHVEEIEIALPSGELRRVSRETDGELFDAVVGGFGLLGAVTAAKLRLKRVHSGQLDVVALPLPSLAELVAELDSRAVFADYLVGWVDCFDPIGRSVLHEARYVAADGDPATLAIERQELPGRVAGVIPRGAAPALLSAFASPRGMAAVNAAKYRASRFRGNHAFRQPHVQFAFLLDYIPGWKRLYQPGGLIQYQSFVPRAEAVRVHMELLALCRRRGIVPWLGVYKKHRAGGFLMEYAMDGYSFAMDFPVTAGNREALWSLCHEMDEIVLAAGGRFYFAKDLTATPEALRRAFTNLDRFRDLKRRVDPQGVLTSDLALRLGV